MTLEAWLDIQTGTGKVVKNLKFSFGGQGDKNIWDAQFLASFALAYCTGSFHCHLIQI